MRQLIRPQRQPLNRTPRANQRNRSERDCQQGRHQQLGTEEFPNRLGSALFHRFPPPFGFRDKHLDHQRQECRERTCDHHPAPGTLRDVKDEADASN
jgi:hypothetical protein